MTCFRDNIIRVVACGIPRQVLWRHHEKPIDNMRNSSEGKDSAGKTREQEYSLVPCKTILIGAHSLGSTAQHPRTFGFAFATR